MILKDLDSRDIANLRLVTPTYRDSPIILFREILIREYPWLWELRELEVDKTILFMLHKKIKFGFGDMMGLRNRRVWGDVEEMLRGVERYKRGKDHRWRGSERGF